MGRHLLRTNTLVNPNATFATVYITRSNSASNYHGLQAQYQRRFAGRWNATAAYTWSHSIDDTSSDNYLDVAASPGSDRASSDFDVRHQLSGALSVLLPKFDKHEALARTIGHWETDWLFLFRTAAPLNVLTGTDPLLIGQTDYARPDLNAGVPIWLSCPTCGGGKKLNIKAFSTPTGRQGTLGRNYLRGFDASQFNTALHRRFKVTERADIQFRAEAFNVFNHPRFAAPDNTMTSTTFGTSTQMFSHQLSGGTNNASGFNTLYQLGSARSLEFALKLDF
jgi:hypothetical protein